MYYGDRLKVLMNIYAISSRKLASAIHVDPSSISRWLNNKRHPSPHSQLVDKTIEFFVTSNCLTYQKQKLIDLVLPNSSEEGLHPATFTKAIKEWLFFPQSSIQYENIFSNKILESESNLIKIDKLFENIKTFSQREPVKISTPKSPLPNDKEMVTETKTVEVYRGIEGLRQALLNIGYRLFSKDRSSTLFLTSQGTSAWHQNPTFYQEWKNLSVRLIKKGHKIKIIYNLSQGFPQFITILNDWLPLLLSGDFDVYYYPKYEESLLSTTIILVPGFSVAYSFATENSNLDGFTFLLEDYAASMSYLKRIDALLLSVKPLINVYKADKMLSLQEDILASENLAGSRYVWRNGLTSLTIPIELYQLLLDASPLSNSQKQKRIQLQKNRKKVMQSNRSTILYRDICAIEALESMVNPIGFDYPFIDIFSTGNKKLPPTLVLKHLQNTLSMLQENDNFELALVDNNILLPENIIYQAYKQNNMVLIALKDENNTPLFLTIKETTILHGFDEYYTNIWEQIPKMNRDKSFVMTKLQTLIQKLQMYIQS